MNVQGPLPEGTRLKDLVALVLEEMGEAPVGGDLLFDQLSLLEDDLHARGIAPGMVLIRALSRAPQSLLAGPEEYKRRIGLEYEVRHGRAHEELTFSDETDTTLTSEHCLAVAIQSNAALIALERFTASLRVPVSELLGMRNLSSLVSAVVAAEVAAVLGERVLLNPHQDGYPDLLPRTSGFNAYAERVRAEGAWSDKSRWTDPGFGGIEVKATNGNTPAAKKVAKRALGEERSDIIMGFDWKAHHRETKALLGCTWDFVDGIPTVTALFWRNDLAEEDWGKIVAPKEGGGRTTSVSIMSRHGLAKMARGWMVRSTDAGLRLGLKNGRMLL